jgi:hypothetical protein
MSDLFQSGDEAKNKYLDKALHANDEAVSGSKFTDLMNKDSSIYQGMPKVEEKKPEPEIPEKPTVDADGYPIISPVHTFRADLTGIISDDKLSMSRIAMMQTGNKPAPEIGKKPPMSLQNKIYLITGIILVVLSIGVLGGVFVLNSPKSDTATPVVKVKEKYLIFAEKKETYNITKSTKSEMESFIKNSVSKFKEEDSVSEIIPAITDEGDGLEYRAPLQTVLNKTNSRIPDELSRTLYDKFFLGMYSKKGITNPFLIIYTNSYDIAYPSLLNWEGLMQDDFNWFFGTSKERLNFTDRIIANKDVRSLEDSSSKVLFFYTFIDDHTILFARTTDTVRKVMDRVREAKFQ